MRAFDTDAAPSKRQLALLPLLALLHLGLWLGLDARWRGKPPRLAEAPRVQMIQLGLIAGLPARNRRDDPSAKRGRTAGRLVSPAQHSAGAKSKQAPAGAEALDAGAHTEAGATETINAAQSSQTTQTAQGPERLKLGLPARSASGVPGTPAQLAAQDPRSNSRRPDLGERMAAALGSDPTLREEIINPGHRRMRQGSLCLDVNDTRNSQLNPFDENARLGPKLMSKCKQ